MALMVQALAGLHRVLIREAEIIPQIKHGRTSIGLQKAF